MSMKYSDIIFILSLCMFKFALDFSYIFVLCKEFEYVGYAFNLSLDRYLFSWVLYFLSFFLLRSNLIFLKDYFFLTAVLGVIAPLLVLWGLDFHRPFYPVFVTFLSIFFVFFSYVFFIRVKPHYFPIIRSGLFLAVTISSVFVLYLLVWYPLSGVRLNLSFASIYDYRELNERISSFGMLAYLNSWVIKIFAVFLLAYFLSVRKYVYASLVCIAFVYFYMASTHKSVLFTPFLVFATWFYFSKSDKLAIVPFGFSFLVFFSFLSYYFLNDLWLSSLIPNRVFEVPALLTFAYFDFFDSNEFIYYSNSFLSRFVEYPYDKKLGHLIGHHIGQPSASANNGFISSAYAQGGLPIVLLYSVLIGYLLSIIDRVVIGGGVKVWFVVIVLMVPIRDFLISIDFLTTLLTGGMFLGIFLLILSRKNL